LRAARVAAWQGAGAVRMNFDGWLLFEIVLAGSARAGSTRSRAGLRDDLQGDPVVNIAIGEMLMMGAYVFFAFSRRPRAADLACHSGRRARSRARSAP
jgi:IS4 transposase